MNLYKKKRGVTLIELIIALGLLTIISSFVFSFFFSNERKLDEVEIKSDLQYESKVIMDKISGYAMAATKVKFDENIDNTPNTITFSTVSDSGVINEDGAIFSIEGNNIYLDTEDITRKQLGSHIESLEVSGDNSKNIVVKLTLKEEEISYSVEESFLFRNSHLK